MISNNHSHPKALLEQATGSRLPEVRLRTYALAAVADLLQDRDAPESAFLLQHLDLVDSSRTDWSMTLVDYFNAPSPVDAHLLQMAGELGLVAIEVLAVALASAVEDDAFVGRAIAHVQKPFGGSRPTLGLLAVSLARTVNSEANPLDALTTGAAASSGLLKILGEGSPLPERPVEVPVALCQALRGQDGIWPTAKTGLQQAYEIPLPSSTSREIERQADALLAADNRTLVIRTGSVAEGKTVAGALANAMGRRPAFVEEERTAGLAPWLLFRSLVPVFQFELSPGVRKLLPAIPYYSGPTIILCGPDGSVEPEVGTSLNWTLPVPSEEERRELWQMALGSRELATNLAENHRHTSGRIAQLGQLASHQSALNKRTRPTQSDIFEASRAGEGIGLDALANLYGIS